jgi:hypothetical protein
MLHERLFGFVPPADGTAYERITAVVLAFLGWQQVAQGSREQREGRRARQVIDVVARHPSGEQRRLIVQCKKYDKKVGKGVLDTLVGVRAQMGDVDLAVVTTVGYTRGARDVACDENVLMLRIRPYEPAEDGDAFVREVIITVIPFQPPVVTNFNLEVTNIEGNMQSGEYAIKAVLEMDDGSPAESLAELMYADIDTFKVGEFDRRVVPAEARWLPSATGRARIGALSWHEVITADDPIETRTTGKGEPVLVVQRIEPDGSVSAGRLVVDRQLFAWDLDDERHVVPRGPLIEGEFLQRENGAPGLSLVV